MKIREILKHKGAAIHTVGPDEPVTAAVALLVQHNIGALVVVADAEIRGIISERDILRALAEGLDTFGATRVSDIMTHAVITGTADSEIDMVMNIMSERRIRHLPVLEDGTLCGMISIGDVVNALRRTTQAENEYLHAYISGTPL
jgi:CBS domain-containing protein